MKEESIKAWFKKIFLRDLNITKKGFVYFLVAFTVFFISIEYVIFLIIASGPFDILAPMNIVFILTLFFSLIFSGFIVDNYMNRMQLLIFSSFGLVAGLFLINFKGTLAAVLGYAIIGFLGGLFLIDLLTILIHESNILNRGRLLGYLFFLSFIFSSILCFLTSQYPIVIPLIELGFTFLLIYIATKYRYTETPERLTSDIRFRDVIKQSAFGYLTAFLVLGFILGNAFPVEMHDLYIDPFMFVITTLLFFIIAGTFLDNMGRKWSFTGGILILSGLIIFAGIFKEVYSAIFFGIALAVILITSLTFCGDFSTERNTLKYRGRIVGMFIIVVLGGFLAGIIVKFLLTQVYEANQEILYWIPDLINGINSFLLIVILVWIMPLPEVLSAKEADWAVTLRNLYVFNKDSICLYAKSFLPETDMIELPPEDLITGGLTGIMTLISEITNEKKNLRIIDKDRVKIYFSYGRSVIVALITTKFLPVLFKKMERFTKSFEKRFEDDLLHFRGKINVFLEKTDPLVIRYFK